MKTVVRMRKIRSAFGFLEGMRSFTKKDEFETHANYI